MTTSATPPCRCGMPKKWIAEPRYYPIEFDERMNEYQIVHQGAKILMRYCFWCGGMLPESKRGSFFTTPDADEMAEVSSLLKDARSHEDVLRILGPPDEIGEGGGASGKRGDVHFSRWDQHLRYTRRWGTLEVYVPVVVEGRFAYSIHGHYLGDRDPQQ